MIKHPLASIFYLLNQPKFNKHELNIEDYFKLNIAQAIVHSFICYPYLHSIDFDFEKIHDISKVWEGSDAETIEVDMRVNQLSSQEIVRFFNHEEDSFSSYENTQLLYPYKKTEEILLQTKTEAINCVHINFNFLTEEPSFISSLLTFNHNHQLPSQFNFSFQLYNEKTHKVFLSQLNDFMGSSLKSSLLHHQLTQSLPEQTLIIKKHKI